MSEFEQITVGYWAIRGLGAPLRMMVMYKNVPLKAVNYEADTNESKNGFDRSSWFSVKPELKAKHALINLPYVSLGDITVTQSNACFQFLGRKLGMLGKNELEQISCEELLCEIMDLRNKVITFSYSSKSDPPIWMESVICEGSHIEKLALWLDRKYEGKLISEVKFFVGDDATAPDFHIWEILDQILGIAKFYNLPGPFAHYPRLQAFHHNFAALPNNSRYLQSKLATLPANFLSAHTFGATPSGDKFIIGESIKDWGGSSGIY